MCTAAQFHHLIILICFQILILHCIFCMVCNRMRQNRNNDDYELARALASCFQQVHRLRLLIQRCPQDVREADDALVSLANSVTQMSITLRM